MTLSVELKNKIKKAYRRGNLTPSQQDFINRAIEQNQITLEELQVTEQPIEQPIEQPSPQPARFTQRQLELVPELAGTQREQYMGEPLGVKETAKGALTALPYAYTAVSSQIKPTSVPGIIAKVASPLVTGLSETGIGLLEGQTPKEASIRGYKAAGGEIAMGAILKAASKILPALAKTTSKANKNVIDKVIKDPDLTKVEPKSNADMTDIIQERLDDFRELKNKEYEKAFSKISSKILNTPTTETKKITNFLTNPKNKIDIENITNVIKNEKPRTYAMDLSIVDRVLGGQAVTPEEIKQVNSLLGKVLRSQNLDPTDRMNINGLKKVVFETLSDSAPQIAKMNKKYAKQQAKLDIAEKLEEATKGVFRVADTKVAAILTQIGKSLSGKRYTKDKIIRSLDKIDGALNIPKNQKMETIMKGTVAQEIIQQAASAPTTSKETFYRMLSPLAGITSTTMINDPLMKAGVISATTIPSILRTEPVAKTLLKTAQLQQRLPKQTGKAASILFGQREARAEDGSYTDTATDFIKNQRGLLEKTKRFIGGNE